MGYKHYSPVIETMAREELERVQWKKLKYQLEYLYSGNEFYRRRFNEAGITPGDIKSPADFREKVPLMDKKDILRWQDEAPPYGTRLGVEPAKVVRTHLTSGTSGVGQEVYGMTRADNDYMSWSLVLYAGGVRRGDICMNTLPFSVCHLAASDSLTQAFIKMGVNHFHLGPFETRDKLRMMLRFRPNFIMAVPAFLTRLTVLCEEMDIVPTRDFPNLKSICLAAAAYEISWVEEMEAFWGAKLMEMYGITQAGNLAGFTCELGTIPERRRGVIHLTEHQHYFEILDKETREPVQPGEFGELVLTNLDLEASPVVRFAMNDRVRFIPYDGCSCGRPFHGMEAGTISRYDDMLKIRVVNVWPEAVDAVVLSSKEVAEYQALVYIDEDGREEVRLTVEFKDGVPPEIKAHILATLPGELKQRVGVSMTAVESQTALPRFDFKVRRWKDERSKGKQMLM